MKWLRTTVAMAACLGVVAGCVQTIPPEALQLSATSLQDRQMQTRRFDSKDQQKIQRASAQVLQDLGFQIDESEAQLGLIVASKDRDATEAGQIAAAIVVAILFGARVSTDKHQKIRASLVARTVEHGVDTQVRITFQRLIWNQDNVLSKIEGVNDPKIYQEFFDKLSQSVFLTAQDI